MNSLIRLSLILGFCALFADAKSLKMKNTEFKPGFCPNPGNVGSLCAFTCSSDSNCVGDLKCCTNQCGGTQCVSPQSTPRLIKPGSCPNTIGLIGICLQGCFDDSSCQGNFKCCSNGCGKTCQAPV